MHILPFLKSVSPTKRKVTVNTKTNCYLKKGMLIYMYSSKKNNGSQKITPSHPFKEGRFEGSRKNRRWKGILRVGSRGDETITEPIILALESSNVDK